MKSQSLVRVSLATSSAAEDAACALFEAQFGMTPTVLTDLRRRTTRVVAYLPAGLRTGDARLKIIRETMRDLAVHGVPIGSNRITLKSVKREDWAESWKRHFKPIRIGRRLVVRASWHQLNLAPGVAEVVLDPGLSFGTGNHATTAYCLREIARAASPGSGASMLDVGCGSGVLAIAAAKLGYGRIEAFDFDPDAVRVAKENAATNGVTFKITRRDVATLRESGGRGFDLVCANLQADILQSHGKRIAAAVRAGGRLVLAGILIEQFGMVERHFAGLGWRLVRSRTEREWRSGTFEN